MQVVFEDEGWIMEEKSKSTWQASQWSVQQTFKSSNKHKKAQTLRQNTLANSKKENVKTQITMAAINSARKL